MSAEALETVVLAGPPNAGKTTLFNALTGSNQRVGNYTGITVERKTGTFFGAHGEKRRLVDLPGCHSLEGGSPDQEIARRYLLGEEPGEPTPDLIVSVVDASQLERHLPLTLELLELGRPTIVALNQVDLAEKTGLRLDPAKLAEELGVPVVPMAASSGRGLVELRQSLRHPFPAPAAAPWVSPDPQATSAARRARVLDICDVVARRSSVHTSTLSDHLDRWLLHPILGLVIFAALMFGVFWTIFSFASIPMDAIEGLFSTLGRAVTEAMPEGDLRSLIVDGIIGGVGGVLVFLPQILLLFFFIGLLESSGYMARAAYLLDGLMSKVGLSGKAFLPLFSAHACAIPGIMATRTIDSAKERLVTIFIAPWMSCSARLPVYFLLIPLLTHSEEGSWVQAGILFSIYLTGIVSSFIVARVLRRKLGPDPVQHHFLLELPVYRAPQWSYIFRHVFERGWAFVSKAGTVILGLSILLWAASTYPKSASEDPAAQLSHSVIGRIGAVIEPVVKPLGFDGRTGTAVLTSFAAREVFNSSLGVMYHVEDLDDDEAERKVLREKLDEATWPDGRKLYTPLTVLSLLVFYIYALQCLPTSAVVAREASSWKWAAGQFFFMSGFAYVAALAVYQIGRLFVGS